MGIIVQAPEGVSGKRDGGRLRLYWDSTKNNAYAIEAEKKKGRNENTPYKFQAKERKTRIEKLA